MPYHSARRRFPLFVLLAVMSPALVMAQVEQWSVAQPELVAGVSGALERYYAITSPDSLRLRYLASSSTNRVITIRGRVVAGDSVTQILALRIGQLQLYPAEQVRIAIGEELYARLLGTRRRAVDVTAVPTLPVAGGIDWIEQDRVALALDRFDLRIDDALAISAGLGAPEAALWWWNDGSIRLGAMGPDWELAALLPLSGGGGDGVGPFRERLLAPVWGGSVALRLAPVTVRLRFAAPIDLDDSLPPYAHTLGASVVWGGEFTRSFGTLVWEIGGGLEEYRRSPGGDSVDRVRRFAPVGGIAWIDPSGNLVARLGTVDLAVEVGAAARLTEHLAFELRGVARNLLRDREPYEHPFTLFLTPRLTF